MSYKKETGPDAAGPSAVEVSGVLLRSRMAHCRDFRRSISFLYSSRRCFLSQRRFQALFCACLCVRADA